MNDSGIVWIFKIDCINIADSHWLSTEENRNGALDVPSANWWRRLRSVSFAGGTRAPLRENVFHHPGLTVTAMTIGGKQSSPQRGERGSGEAGFVRHVKEIRRHAWADMTFRNRPRWTVSKRTSGASLALFPRQGQGSAGDGGEGKMKQQESSHGKTRPVIRHEYHGGRPAPELAAVINNQKSSVICGTLFSPHGERTGPPLVAKTRKDAVRVLRHSGIFSYPRTPANSVRRRAIMRGSCPEPSFRINAHGVGASDAGMREVLSFFHADDSSPSAKRDEFLISGSNKSGGFTLVEMMVGIAILAILLSFAVPSFSLWIENLGIRAAAESIQGGLMLARTEALKRNTVMRFQLTSSVGADCAAYDGDKGTAWAWVVSRDDAVTGHLCGAAASETDAPRIVQSYDGNQANGNKARIAAGQSLFTFNGLGRLVSSPANILVTGAEGKENCAPKDGSRNGKARCLRVEVSTGGVRMCDPALPGSDTQACI